jgi:alkanesulfonate monooxygenase SsuD/methylene tetrahydromethanopterin reductase-like flavin-dependent oxidoreductase (luciferase family)
MLVGSPQTIARKLDACIQAGVPHIMLCFNYGHMSRDEADRQLGLFLDEVYPRFKAAPGVKAGDRIPAAAL